ncbi:glycogenin-1 isoform X1 [Falco rusticolus]|uniref:glycogenin-1 isoform X1 n=1 Tax=Falco rusticolus TaxID=120794 RepID=UPI0018866C94|nr:glycogenin-1 isoform X1 [Falco rusticolus]
MAHPARERFVRKRPSTSQGERNRRASAVACREAVSLVREHAAGKRIVVLRYRAEAAGVRLLFAKRDREERCWPRRGRGGGGTDLSINATDVTGEQQQYIEHKLFKQRLDKPANRVTPEAERRDQSFVTLATNDSYVKGALVLGSSLQQYRTTRKLTALITPQVSDLMRRVLEKVFDEVILVNVLDSGDSAHLALMKRPELGVTLTKLHCWELTQFSKCVFMDADTMVLSNIDELFEREELSAAPDPGWPDCFNSGVFVYRPSIETYNQLLQFATEKGSFDATLVLAYQTTSRSFDLIATSTFKLRCDLSQHGADQGLLNTFFSSWATTDISKHLPFIYNLSSTSVYSYLPAFKAFGANTKVVHFLGSTKPWNYTYDSRTKSIKGNMDAPKIVHPEFLNMWWDTYIADVLPLLEQHGIVNDITTGVNMLSGLVYTLAFSCGFCREAEVTEAVSHISVSAPVLPTVSSEERKERWEQGQADYMGVDSFDNIKKKLDTYLQ